MYGRAIAVWTAVPDRENYLTYLLKAEPEAVQYVPILEAHEISVGHHLKRLSAIMSWVIEAAGVPAADTYEETGTCSSSDVPASGPSQRMPYSSAFHDSKPYGCMQPSCAYTCGIGSQTPVVLGNHQQRAQQGRSSVDCNEKICQDIAKSVTPAFHEWIIPPHRVLKWFNGIFRGEVCLIRIFQVVSIGFISPPSDVASCVPEKIHDFSAIDPANRNTYIYGMRDQSEYDETWLIVGSHIPARRQAGTLGI